MAKRMDSPYLLGKRSDSWLKMKSQKLAICNVIGYVKGEGYRNLLEALLIAQHRENRLIDTLTSPSSFSGKKRHNLG